MGHDLDVLAARFGRHYPRWLLALLIISTMTMVLSSTSINVALPAIMQDFAIGRPLAQWLVTGVLAAMTSGLLLSSWAQARFGPRATLLTSFGLFLVTSLVAPFVTSIWALIAIRIVQGLCAGIAQPLSMVLIFRTYPGEGRGMALGLFGLGAMMAPALGPTLAGFLVDHFGWRAVFWLPAPVCILSLVGGALLLPTLRSLTPPRLDVPGFILLNLALFGILAALAEAQRFGWLHDATLLTGAVGLLGLAAFLWRCTHHSAPLLPLRLWRNASFRHTSWVSMVLGVSLFGVTYLVPLYVQTVEGYSASDAGLLLLPTGLVLGVAVFAGGWLSDKLAARWLLVGGLGLLTLSTAGQALMGTGASFWAICAWASLGRLGIGGIMPGVSTAAVQDLPAEELAPATGTISFMRQLGGALGINLLTFFIEWRHVAEGASAAGDAQAFVQSFWLLTALFALALWPAWLLRSKR
ncbi:drug resistance transporter, EmrB/QacA subfamily [Geopseudomonas sagittaria]|uniref:Drug resistance transporter, EmrB/QacA subfamily n=1 Tax=Geopseudomonas sagittaria TaxID=1135990 RepID=A0A1I5U0T2_9GAMM|nr:DHA2 family efflux MFS transporter permease subunit [Pseudomonas sagittaria]MCM2331073.1 DHA2 family efflux MFS transporter permease subunit [Pseudomonas sagittaria]SFP88912.1 drug resistance transporter, EmrB/QacA subfamily [Pseudomonas sagittaria]